VCVPARLSAFHVTTLHYSVCASKAVCNSCYHTSLQCLCQQACLQLSPYCNTLFLPARLSAVHFTTLNYSVCASKAVYCSCHHTALECVCQQGCLQFMSPYCITLFVPARFSAVNVTTLHYSLCCRKAVCISCHHIEIQYLCLQGCLQFMSTYCITVCVPVRLSAVRVTILHYSVCVCQQGCLQFMSPHCITVCVPARLSAVHVTILHYSICANKAVCSSFHHTSLQCVCQQGCLQFMSPYCFTVCVCQQGFLQFVSQYCIEVCVPARLSAVRVIFHAW